LKDSSCKQENASSDYAEIYKVWKVKIFYNVYAITISNL